MFGEHSLPILRKGDANLVVGTYIVPEVFPELGRCVRAGREGDAHRPNAYEIAKNHPVDLGIVADPKLTLALLATRSNGRCRTRSARRRRRGIEQGAQGKEPRSTRPSSSRIARSATPCR